METEPEKTISRKAIPLPPDAVPEADLIDEMAIAEMLPQLNVNAGAEGVEKCIVSDQELLTLYDEVLNDCRDDRKSIDELLTNFIDMVTNDGDSTKETKEALVNLVKIKSDIADKKAKIADFKTRIKLKERDTFPRYLAAHQHNNVTFEGNKQEIMAALKKAQKLKREQ